MYVYRKARVYIRMLFHGKNYIVKNIEREGGNFFLGCSLTFRYGTDSDVESGSEFTWFY